MADMKINVAFIGGGNMARAMITGLIAGGHPVENILVCTPSKKACDQLNKDFRIKTEQDNASALAFADVIVLAVKPAKVPEVCVQLVATAKSQELPSALIISVAAGVSFHHLNALLNDKFRGICAMPNLPCAIGEGVIGLYAAPESIAIDVNLADGIMSKLGRTIWVEEETHMPAIVAAAGSAPAYFFLMLEQMESVAMRLGLTKEQARICVLQSAKGAVDLVNESEAEFAALRRQVTSPKGTTEQALNSFYEDGFGAMVFKAMQAAAHKASAAMLSRK